MSRFKGYGGDDLPDPKEMLRKLRANLQYVIYGAIGLAVVLGALNSYYTVEADERAIVLRFGKPTGEEIEPGLHFRIPVIDQVFKAQTTKIRQLEFGFRTQKADVRSRVDENVREEGLMLTGDLELVNVQWTVLYRIKNLEDYLFRVRDVDETIRDISEAKVRLLVGDHSSDEVMMTMREAIAGEAAKLLQESLDEVRSGVHVEGVALRQVDPPAEAQEAFDRVNEARARKQQTIEMAKREKAAQERPMEGKKDAIIARARGYRDRQIAEARGEASKFLQILAEYNNNREITRQWLYLQTMLRVWTRVGRKFIVDEDQGSTVRLLPLGDMGFGGAMAPAPLAPAGNRDGDVPAMERNPPMPSSTAPAGAGSSR